MPFGLQPIHIVVVVIVALIVFGPRRLPEVGRWVGRTLAEVRKGTQEMTSTLRDEMGRAATEEHPNTIAKPNPPESVPSVPSPSAPVDRKFCTKCGAPNPTDAMFCNRCGNPFQAQP